MRSMTGFGHYEWRSSGFDLSVDAKSVNSRYFDLKARLPNEFAPFENELRSRLQEKIERGRVDLFVEFNSKAEDQLELNPGLVRSYLELDEKLRSLGARGKVTTSELLAFEGVVQKKAHQWSEEELKNALFEAVDRAVDRLVDARCQEGEALRRELEARLVSLSDYLEKVEELAGEIAESQRSRLESRLQEFERSALVDEARLSQEIIFYVERADISEELTRLESHISRFRGYILASGEESVGKKLDFLCQELNRETNTILAKAGKVGISELAVESKSEIERIREQVQNVE